MGSTDEHFGGGGLKRWWSPIGGSSNDVKNVLPILSTTRDLARHGGQAFNILANGTWINSQYGYLRLVLYTIF